MLGVVFCFFFFLIGNKTNIQQLQEDEERSFFDLLNLLIALSDSRGSKGVCWPTR